MNLPRPRPALIDALKRRTGFWPNRLIVAMAAGGAANAATRNPLDLSSCVISAVNAANSAKSTSASSPSVPEINHARARTSLRQGDAAELKQKGAPPNGKGEWRDVATDGAGPGVAHRNRSALDWPVDKTAFLSS